MIIESFMLFIQKLMFFTSYVNNTSSFPKPLSQAEEKEYLERFENGDMKAKEILIQHNLRLVAHIVKKYGQTEEADDLISVGSLGLIKALNTYKLNHGTQFSTYAARCIENEILMLIRANKKHKNTVSIEDVLGADEDNNEITIGDLNYDDEQDVSKVAENKYIAEKLDVVLKRCLSDREYQIMCLRYGLNGNPVLPQREVAKKLNISRSYISRLEKKSIEILRKKLDRKHFGL
ncbi:MAG: sigma-70 family RNA polymerase sigma factor [Clostridiales bacterium]|nr:sigma-70 family RNA polymerase sigma factor [Clostridiales bacterium]